MSGYGFSQGRELVPACRIKEYLGYSDLAGNEMIDDAIELAKRQYFVF